MRLYFSHNKNREKKHVKDFIVIKKRKRGEIINNTEIVLVLFIILGRLLFLIPASQPLK